MATESTHPGDYRPGVSDGQRREAHGRGGAVVIEGRRTCGRTETARQAAATEIRMDTPDARQAFAVDPAFVLMDREWNTQRSLG